MNKKVTAAIIIDALTFTVLLFVIVSFTDAQTSNTGKIVGKDSTAPTSRGVIYSKINYSNKNEVAIGRFEAELKSPLNGKNIKLLDSLKSINRKIDSMSSNCKYKLRQIKVQQSMIQNLPDSLTTKN